MVIAAVAIGAIAGVGGDKKNSDGPLPALTYSAPPHAAAQTANCTKLLTGLPVQLGKLPGRVVHTKPDSPFVVAWGDPPIVLQCGAARPKTLQPGDSEQYFPAGDANAGPWTSITRAGDANVYTTVDRGPYVSITIPAHYAAADYLPTLGAAIRKELPAVCSTESSAPLAQLCNRRK